MASWWLPCARLLCLKTYPVTAVVRIHPEASPNPSINPGAGFRAPRKFTEPTCQWEAAASDFGRGAARATLRAFLGGTATKMSLFSCNVYSNSDPARRNPKCAGRTHAEQFGHVSTCWPSLGWQFTGAKKKAAIFGDYYFENRVVLQLGCFLRAQKMAFPCETSLSGSVWRLVSTQLLHPFLPPD